MTEAAEGSVAAIRCYSKMKIKNKSEVPARVTVLFSREFPTADGTGLRPATGDTLGPPDTINGRRDVFHANGDSFLLQLDDGEDVETLPDLV